MPDSTEIENTVFPSNLKRGAKNAILSCLSVTPDDVATLICDEASLTVAAALLEQLSQAGAKTKVFIMERRTLRPAVDLPPEIARALSGSTVSIYTLRPMEGEYTHRKEIIGMVGPNKLRHAHMIGISEDSMLQGMLSDYRLMSKLNEVMVEKLRNARSLRVTCPKGTDVNVTLDLAEKIESAAGIIEPGSWENLPSGEIYTCPRSVDGVYICDGIPPTEDEVDRFELGQKPLRIELSGGRVTNISGGPGSLANKVLAAVRSGTNVDRIGMLGIGTNYDLLMPIGDRVQDQFVPGAYFSMGRPAAVEATSWTSSQQLTFSARKTSLEIDGKIIINNGRYVQEILDLAMD